MDSKLDMIVIGQADFSAATLEQQSDMNRVINKMSKTEGKTKMMSFEGN